MVCAKSFVNKCIINRTGTMAKPSRITSAYVYRVELPCRGGKHTFAGGRGGDSSFHSLVVQLDTDAGISGYGEVGRACL